MAGTPLLPLEPPASQLYPVLKRSFVRPQSPRMVSLALLPPSRAEPDSPFARMFSRTSFFLSFVILTQGHVCRLLREQNRREGEKHNRLSLQCTLIWDRTCNLGTCPDGFEPTPFRFMRWCSSQLSHVGQPGPGFLKEIHSPQSPVQGLRVLLCHVMGTFSASPSPLPTVQIWFSPLRSGRAAVCPSFGVFYAGFSSFPGFAAPDDRYSIRALFTSCALAKKQFITEFLKSSLRQIKAAKLTTEGFWKKNSIHEIFIKTAIVINIWKPVINVKSYQCQAYAIHRLFC